MVLDADFNRLLTGRLQTLMQHSCKRVEPGMHPIRTWGRQIAAFALFHFLRFYPTFAGWLPAHRSRIRQVAPVTGAIGDAGQAESREQAPVVH